MGMGEETIKTSDWKLLPDAFQFVGISRCNRIPTRRGLCRQSREWKGREGKEIMLRIRSHNLM
jgi:hypothetical protein